MLQRALLKADSGFCVQKEIDKVKGRRETVVGSPPKESGEKRPQDKGRQPRYVCK